MWLTVVFLKHTLKDFSVSSWISPLLSFSPPTNRSQQAPTQSVTIRLVTKTSHKWLEHQKKKKKQEKEKSFSTERCCLSYLADRRRSSGADSWSWAADWCWAGWLTADWRTERFTRFITDAQCSAHSRTQISSWTVASSPEYKPNNLFTCFVCLFVCFQEVRFGGFTLSPDADSSALFAL